MALNDPATYVDSAGGRIETAAMYAWNGTAFVAAPMPARALYVTGASVGNGADLTADTLQSYNIPANTMANVGDMVRIHAAGVFISSTDNKTAIIKFGSATLATINTATAGVTRWAADITVVRTSASNQSWMVLSAVQGSSVGNGINAGTSTQTDTAIINILVTGQNATNSVANSVTCQILTVEFIPGP
jgi:hypothetical protein